jgi:hypothetical protein
MLPIDNNKLSAEDAWEACWCKHMVAFYRMSPTFTSNSMIDSSAPSKKDSQPSWRTGVWHVDCETMALLEGCQGQDIHDDRAFLSFGQSP